MAASSPGHPWSWVRAGIGGIYVFRIVQRLRYRAVHPDMDDPGRTLLRWLPWIPVALAAVMVLVAIGLFNWLGPAALLLVIACVLLALLIGAAAGVGIWLRADQRRRVAGYVICEADYAIAPRQIKSTMRRIYSSANSVRTGQAYKEGIFGELGLEQLVFSAAERAMLCSQLRATTEELYPGLKTADRALIADVDTQITAIKQELSEVEQALKNSAGTASALSKRITEPERQRAAQKTNDEAAAADHAARAAARKRVEDARSRATMAPSLEPTDVEERISAVAAGYDEAAGITDRILGNIDNKVTENANTKESSARSSRGTAARAARFTADQAAKWSAVAAKAGVEKIKNRDTERSTDS